MTCVTRHGVENLPFWCGHCILEAQIKYVTEVASRLPELRARLKELDDRGKKLKK